MTMTAYADLGRESASFNARWHDMHRRPSSELVIVRGRVPLFWGSTATEVLRAIAEETVRQCDRNLQDQAHWTIDPAF